MTYEQAQEAARQRWPVRCRGIEFMRIEEVGRSFTVRGDASDFVLLLDRYQNSVVRVRPDEVELIGGDVFVG